MQRTIRLAINATNTNIDAWKAAIDDGKKHATNLTNAILTSGHIPQLPMAALKDIPNLKNATLNKLSLEIARHYTLLANSLTSLEGAAAGLVAAIAPLAELALQEKSESLLHGSPVFTLLPLHTIAGMFEKVEKRYWAELERKRAVVEDFQTSAVEAQKLAAATINSSTNIYSVKGGKSPIECSKGFLQVHITAWMLSPEIEEEAVQADLSVLTQDAASC
ncbi:hypothetical protein KSW81_006576 [Nannochloris sp. 'desiccata']|nr:hypothetical protein KSW81_006576 [Chlorella desiccata (nom. nud.)]